MPQGLVKATAGIATLLMEGIGDTIRYSLTADPVEEAKAGRVLLESLGLRERRGLDLIACPSCGRAEIDVIAVANAAQAALEGLKVPIQVAVMGCVVNGPGEARSADLGIAAGRKRGHLFIDGQVVKADGANAAPIPSRRSAAPDPPGFQATSADLLRSPLAAFWQAKASARSASATSASSHTD